MLVTSGIAKLRTPDDLQGWRELGVPESLRQAWLLKLHPWAEIALGLAVALLGGWLGVFAGLVSLVLMLAYTWLIRTALRKPEDTSCACFGEPTTITQATLTRNLWLVGLAGLTAAVIWSTPLLGGALGAAAAVNAWWWLVGAALAVGTTVVILREGSLGEAGGASAAGSTGASVTGSGGVSVVPVAEAGPAWVDVPVDSELDYVRTRTPAVPVTLADGTVRTLRELSTQRPLLILAVSETCAACQPVLDKVVQWRDTLPELDIHLLLQAEPTNTRLTETAHPQSLHDPQGYVRQSIQEWPTPTAVLLGIDGMLAGGPISGPFVIESFVANIRAELDGA